MFNFIIKKTLLIWGHIKYSLRVYYEEFFSEKPWYLMPIGFITFLCMMWISLADMPITLFPRKFKCVDDFYAHVYSIYRILDANDQPDWAAHVHYALFISQSYYERKGELLRVLPALKRQKFVKQLNLKKDINKAISYLKSL